MSEFEGVMELGWLQSGVKGLAEHGWYCAECAVDKHSTDALTKWINSRMIVGGFSSAGVGKGERLQANNDIRRDAIFWLSDELKDDCLIHLNDWVEKIRVGLNRELFAGLESFEGHFAVYPPGGFYVKHVDTFRDDDARSITLILYLNNDWRQEQGGHLRLYCDGEKFTDIEPRVGTVVLFDSRKFPHEVLTARAMRRSFTGWFKVRKI